MKISIPRACIFTLVLVSWLLGFAAYSDLQGQTLSPSRHSSQMSGKTGKTRKRHSASTPAQYTYEVLYNFCSLANCADGDEIAGGLIRDAAGNLYGVTNSGGNANPVLGVGAVFELDAAGHETVLHSFCSQPNCADGVEPNSLVMDSAGNLYGTAAAGGANESTFPQSGVVFELEPPGQPGGAWTETVLYNFCSATDCSDGYSPSSIVRDAAGNIYGTTQYGAGAYGTIFELARPSQPGGTWTETVLHVFCPSRPCEDGMIPNGGLIQDAAGNMYGTTMYGPDSNGNPYLPPPLLGTVFQLAPPSQPGGSWTETVIHIFCSLANCADGLGPSAGLIMDAAGNLYGTAGGGTPGGGTVFEFAPPSQPGGAWSETVLYNFCSLANCADGQDPIAALTQDAAGNLFGTTEFGGGNQNVAPGSQLSGTAFELSPPAQAGGVWTETVLYNFCSAGGWNCTDGLNPFAGLLRDPVGNLYGTTWAGGSHGGGTAFMLALPTFTVTGTAVSIDAGATTGNTSTITLNPIGSFTGNVTLTAAITSSPKGAQDLPTLSFAGSNPVSITASSAVTTTLIVSTTAASSAALNSPWLGSRWFPGSTALAFGLIFSVGVCVPKRARKWRTRTGLSCCLLILTVGLLSCGGNSTSGGGTSGTGNSGTTPGTYVVTVSGVSGSTMATGTVTVTVQ